MHGVFIYVCTRACVHACVRAYVPMCACARVHACMCVCSAVCCDVGIGLRNDFIFIYAIYTIKCRGISMIQGK